jgi:hypothetical protein
MGQYIKMRSQACMRVYEPPRGPSLPAAASSATRCDFPELAVELVRDDTQRTVAPLPHVTDALSAIGEQVFLAGHPIVLHGQADQQFVFQPAYEQAAALSRKRIAGVELRAGWRDHRVPVTNWLLHAGTRGCSAYHDTLMGR